MPAEKQASASVTAELILKQFIAASINRHHGDYYDLVSSMDQSAKTRDQYLEEQQALQPNLADAYFDKISYQISSIIITDTTASAEVVYQFPDAERMIKQVYNLAILEKQSLPPLAVMKQQMDAAYQDKPMPMKTITRRFTLQQEVDGWRVVVGWNKNS